MPRSDFSWKLDGQTNSGRQIDKITAATFRDTQYLHWLHIEIQIGIQREPYTKVEGIMYIQNVYNMVHCKCKWRIGPLSKGWISEQRVNGSCGSWHLCNYISRLWSSCIQVFRYFNFKYVQVVFIRISAAIQNTWCIFEALWEFWKLSNNLLVIFTWAST